jgi:crotonobetainyl-CoA:carnitine CoA-transferase CaiB-like acyl-CoA transferase
MSGILDGIKVIDCSQVAAIPMAARHLADFGADVVHIENPATGDSWRSYQAGQGPGNNGVPSDFNYNWENFNRNKRSMTLNLANEEGQKIMHNMVKQADIFLTNMRPFEIENFKIGYDILNKINPRIIYASVTGFGKKGPDRNVPAYDITAYWTRSGFAYMLTQTGMPGPGFRAAMGDNVAALAIANGVNMALYQREKTGVGQEIDVSLLHTGLYQISFDVAGFLTTGMDYKDTIEKPPQEMIDKILEAMMPVMVFYRKDMLNPLASMYLSKDAVRILLMMLTPDRYWPKFCRTIGIPEIIDDPRFNTFDGRAQNKDALMGILDKVFRSKTWEEWKPILADIPHAPATTLKEAINDPQAEANNFYVEYEHPSRGKIKMLANPINMSKNPATVRMAAPEFGQHTEEVLLEYGYTWNDIIQFKEKGVIA